MDDLHFDQLAQALGRRINRRGVVAVLVGLVAAAVRDTTAKRRHRTRKDRHKDDRRGIQADKKGKKKACLPCKTRKKGKCKGTAPDRTPCPGGSCLAGQCIPTSPNPTPPPDGETCTAGFHDCSGSCVSDNDVAHCGTACTPCPSSDCKPATCDGTSCGRSSVPECCDEDRDCGENDACTIHTCTEVRTCSHGPVQCTSDDPCRTPVCELPNGCTTVDRCRPTEVCHVDGAIARCCPQDHPFWNGSRCAACTATDVSRCENHVNATATCDAQGTCGFACLAGWDDCGASGECETDLTSDPQHCGTCQHACSTVNNTPTCQDGTCVLGTCDAGWVDCDGNPETGCETWTQTDPDHCGACGVACTGTDWCISGTCTPAPVCLPATEDLQAAIDAASPGATITLCPGTWVLTTTVSIPKDLTLIGSGTGRGRTILDGGGTVGVLQISWNHTVRLQNLKITNGVAPQGGGIYNLGMLTLVDVEVSNNAATYGEGGGMYSRSGTMTLEGGCRVMNNSALFRGGGIFIWEGVVTLSDTRVSGNVVLEGYGGGICNLFDTVTLKAGSQVTGNSAQNGGGIHNEDTLILEAGSRVEGNTAQVRYGGGIMNLGPNARLTLRAESTVARNTAPQGGGIAHLSYLGTATLEAGSRVTNNIAQDGGGIGIFDAPGEVTLGDTDIVTNNYLMDRTTLSNCAPVDTIPNCVG